MTAHAPHVFFEPRIPEHDPALYAYERIDDGVPASAAEAAAQ